MSPVSLGRVDFLGKAVGKGCLVVGDIILDRYIYGEVGRISPEAPVPVVKAGKESYVLGGAANVAGNIRGFHLKVYLCGVLGNDESASKARELLSERDIGFCGIVVCDRRTTLKSRVIGMNQQLLRIDQEDTVMIGREEEETLIQRMASILHKVQIVVLSDYGKGICSNRFCRRLMEICRQAGKPVIVDPKDDDWTKYQGAYLITPNFKEFCSVSGHSLDNTEKSIGEHAAVVMEEYGLAKILVTRSQYGMTLVREAGRPMTFRSIQQEVYDVTGAGDTVIATVAAFLAVGAELEDALRVANYAAGLAVSKVGTYMVTLEEVAEYVDRTESWYGDKIWDIDKLSTMIQMWRRMGEKVVFTNGCFDILHIGHIDYLNKAKKLGSKLVIGLNTDDSVRRLKGKSRPINSQRERALALAALECVDAVILFEEDTPEELIRHIRPDCLVKGGDYELDEIAGRQYVDEVCTIPLTKGYSTTGFLYKIGYEKDSGE